jgi:hypothetical protein
MAVSSTCLLCDRIPCRPLPLRTASTATSNVYNVLPLADRLVLRRHPDKGLLTEGPRCSTDLLLLLRHQLLHYKCTMNVLCRKRAAHRRKTALLREQHFRSVTVTATATCARSPNEKTNKRQQDKAHTEHCPASFHRCLRHALPTA